VLVERSAAQRRRHATKVPIEDPNVVLPAVDPDTGEPVPDAPAGPLCTSLADLPRAPGVSAVVLANELLDNLPFDLALRRDGGWCEARVGLGLAEVLVPLDEARASLLDRLAPDAPDGARVPLQAAAGEWLRSAVATAGPKGRVVALDYATTTADLASRPVDEWVRTYRDHARGAPYLSALGAQDVTCEVAVDQLAVVRPPRSTMTQAEWLRSHGIDDLVAEGRKVWTERAHLGDLTAVAARSRIGESEALLDPAGLGAFLVLEW
jgi:SAM-dependent MidA family methyltransferase